MASSAWIAITIMMALAQTDTGADATPPPAPPAAPAAPAAPEPPAPAATTAEPEAKKQKKEISLEDWNRDDWMLLKPELSMLEIDGYLRMRAGLYRNLDFGNQFIGAVLGGTSRYPAVSGNDDAAADRSANFSGTNISLALNSTINVSSNIQVHLGLDILENFIMGSTPNLYGSQPINSLSSGQDEATGGVNSVQDAIQVRTVYGRLTALNDQLEVRFGRMPSHWGLGMFINSGECLDCDYDQTSDRISASLRMADHVFVGMFDWVSSGPAFNAFGSSTGQPHDAFTWDDVSQYSAQVLRVDHPDDIRDHINQGEWVINYGAWAMLRKQARDVAPEFYTDAANTGDATEFTRENANGSGSDLWERRDATFLMGDAFARLYFGEWEIAAEGAMIYGDFKDTTFNDEDSTTTSVMQWGTALELTYHLDPPGEGADLGLRAGAASGDRWVGMGTLDTADGQRGIMQTGNVEDSDLNNFQFSPNYHVDLLLFRQVLGTVSDAWYVRPEATYAFTDAISGSLAGIYSQAFFPQSTPRCWPTETDGTQSADDETGDKSCNSSKPAQQPLGIEFDAELTYKSQIDANGGGLLASLRAGILFPLGGFEINDTESGETSLAWTIQSTLAITF
jgi:uncharacterized protein (TIGR04551 family)